MIHPHADPALLGEPAPLDTNELNYLLMLAGKQRRKRMKEREKFVRKTDVTEEEFARFLQRHDHDTAWVRSVEDHLILLVAAADEKLLLDHHRERLAEIR